MDLHCLPRPIHPKTKEHYGKCDQITQDLNLNVMSIKGYAWKRTHIMVVLCKSKIPSLGINLGITWPAW